MGAEPLKVDEIDWASVINTIARSAGARPNQAIVKGCADVAPAVFNHYSIDTVDECAAFVAQSMVECDHFKTLTEYWGPTPTQRGYEGRRDLGNTKPGDGPKFRGHGVFQITGRANHAQATVEYNKLGMEQVDFTVKPELLATPHYAMWSAGIYWSKNKLNSWANNPSAMSRAINRGNPKSHLPALAEPIRIKYFRQAQSILLKPPKLSNPPAPPTPATPVPPPTTTPTIAKPIKLFEENAVEPADTTVFRDPTSVEAIHLPPTTAQSSGVTLSSPSTDLSPMPEDNEPSHWWTVTKGQVEQYLGQSGGGATVPSVFLPPVVEPSPVSAPAAVPANTPLPAPNPVSPTIANVVIARVGEENNETLKAVQIKLMELNYALGTPNGCFGPLTVSALISYEANNNLPLRPDVLDSFTMHKIMTEGVPFPISEARRTATANSPELQNSRQIILGKIAVKVGGVLLSLLGIDTVTNNTPEKISQAIGANIPMIQDKLVVLNQLLNTLFTSRLTVGVLLAMIIVGALSFMYLRVQDHRDAKNLAR